MTFNVSVSGSTTESPYVGLKPEQQDALKACAAEIHEALDRLREKGFQASGTFYHGDVGNITL